MPHTHKTKDGRTMLIAEMADSHLVNTVKLMIDRIFVLKLHIETPTTFSNKLSQKLYGTRMIDEESALQLIPHLIDGLQDYLAEAWFRRIDVPQETQEKLESILGRKGQLIISPAQRNVTLAALTSGTCDPDWDEEDPSENWGDK